MASHLLSVLSLLLGLTCLLLNGCGEPPTPSPSPPVDPGEPLVITDILKKGDFQHAQDMTRVDLSTFGWTGKAALHSGFFALDSLGNATRQTFFWYSAAQSGHEDAPVLLWLQGGPGVSSLYGMFTEIGPFVISEGRVQPRNVSWNDDFHLLFLDNPVGTGFSYTDSEAGYATTHEQAGQDLRNAISQFFLLFPKLHTNDFYITGESYAGKWVPAAAYAIHQYNKLVTKDTQINLKGISIGDGAFDPKRQFQGFGDLLWFLGMADASERKKFQEYEGIIQDKLNLGDNVGAFEAFDEMLNGDFYPYPTYYANVTGMSTNYFNFELAPDAVPLGGDFVDWLRMPAVRAQIHVGWRKYKPANSTVEARLKGVWMLGQVDQLVTLMENYKVLVYSGQNDVILGAPLTEQSVDALNWTGKADYAAAKKVVWRRSASGTGSKLPDVAGYVRQAQNFTYAVVRGAGHMVPGDQPERALDLLKHFISGTSFTSEEKAKMNIVI